MTTAPTILSKYPTDPKTGLTLPLSKSLDLQDLSKHRAMVAFELEVMAKKTNKYRWEDERGTPAHDRLVTDWMDALHDFPLSEVKAACAAWVLSNPRKMPNEGDIRAEIQRARHKQWLDRKATLPAPRETYSAQVTQAERDRMAAYVKEAGFTPKRFGGDA